jgi:hypothetical protein
MDCYFSFELHLLHTLIDSKHSNKEIMLDAAETIIDFLALVEVFTSISRGII